MIDALDECKDEHAASTVLTALSVFADSVSPIKFFITSRPVAIILRGFYYTGLMKDTNALVLHSIPSDISQKDIHVYLEDRLSSVARFLQLEGWPSTLELATLVEQSKGLFIFAATVANFIDDRHASNPKRQLKVLLSTRYIASSGTSPLRHLDELYLAVLHEAFPNLREDQGTSLRMVLGTIALLFDPLCAESLDALLEVEVGTVRSTFQHLHSIAIVPRVGGGPVRLIHPSFHDFVVDVNRCDDVNFVVDPRCQHTLLADRCLQVLQTMSSNMCKIGDPSQLNQQVDDLQYRIATHIPAYTQYACRHWASHLSSGNISNTTLDLLLEISY